MADFVTWLALWFHFQYFMAGVAGGLVATLLPRDRTASDILQGMIIGGIATNYLTAAFVKFTGANGDQDLVLAGAFILGMVGRPLCANIIVRAKSWTPFKGL
jgi:hypothetical protein